MSDRIFLSFLVILLGWNICSVCFNLEPVNRNSIVQRTDLSEMLQITLKLSLQQTDLFLKVLKKFENDE
ncbi:hypothetical protein HZS_5809, partial [Henneguya salminicola]